MDAGSVNAVRKSRRHVLAGLAIGVLALPAVAFGHLERPSYWPDPAPDTSVSPAAGGKVPKARSLGSAISGNGPGQVRVVCKRSSLNLAVESISRAHTRGFRLRPSQPKKKLSDQKAQKLLRINRSLSEMCAFKSIQKAIDKSRNNDRIVIMPGRYTESKSRKAPVNDPKCNPSMLQEDQSGAMTPSYEYQAKCSNDQNLLYVQGRKVKGEPLAAPDANRHGIPEQELGKCVRCNLQIEGSGAKPEDVLLDAGKGYIKPKKPGSRPGGDIPAEDCLAAPDGPDNPCYAKHVVLRGDRTDGFVGRNFLMRGAKEHGFYTEESDGVLLDRVKFFWNADYGHLSFTSDHSVVKNCDGYGSGDAVVYPGAAPQTGEFRDETFYPEERFNTVIKKCDLHGSAMGYSGSMGNSVRVTRNNFYGNANGLTSDTLSAPGHPGFPADGQQVDHNLFYSNNLNVYAEDFPFAPLVPQAVGTGIMWPGMNNGRFEDNKVFDNWRHGTLLVSIPDAVAGEAEGAVDSSDHCPADAPASTSCGNQYSGNNMGNVPAGFKKHPSLSKFGNESGLLGGSTPETLPNGVDFWWDEAATNTGNCWFDNTGAGGGPVTSDPLAPLLPSEADCDAPTNVGNPASYAVKAPQLLECFAEWEFRGDADTVGDGPCYWYQMPPQPGTPRAAAEAQRQDRIDAQIAKSPEAERLKDYYGDLADQIAAGD